jgi:hypothetical protein
MGPSRQNGRNAAMANGYEAIHEDLERKLRKEDDFHRSLERLNFDVASMHERIMAFRSRLLLSDPEDFDAEMRRHQVLDLISFIEAVLVSVSPRDVNFEKQPSAKLTAAQKAYVDWCASILEHVSDFMISLNGDVSESTITSADVELCKIIVRFAALIPLHDNPELYGSARDLGGAQRRAEERLPEANARLLRARESEALKEAQAAAAEAQVAARAAKEAAGTAGRSTLTEHFETYAGREQRKSLFYLTGTVVSLAASIGSGASAVLTTPASGFGSVEAAKALVTLPVLWLAYYLSRESSVHSEAARRASEIRVRLATIEAFSEVLDEPQRRDMRNSLGQLVFGQLDPAVAVNNLGKEYTEAVAALAEVAKYVTQEAVGQKKAEVKEKS